MSAATKTTAPDAQMFVLDALTLVHAAMDASQDGSSVDPSGLTTQSSRTVALLTMAADKLCQAFHATEAEAAHA